MLGSGLAGVHGRLQLRAGSVVLRVAAITRAVSPVQASWLQGFNRFLVFFLILFAYGASRICPKENPRSVRPARSMDESHTSSKEKVKPDKNQRAAMQSLAGADALQLLLQQVFERASLDGVVTESFYLQQQIHREMEKYPSPDISPPKRMRTMRNLHRLLSRMSLKQMIQCIRHSPVCDSFLEDVQTQMASINAASREISGVRLPKSVWL